MITPVVNLSALNDGLAQGDQSWAGQQQGQCIILVCAVPFKLASSVVFHIPIEFLMNVISALLALYSGQQFSIHEWSIEPQAFLQSIQTSNTHVWNTTNTTLADLSSLGGCKGVMTNCTKQVLMVICLSIMFLNEKTVVQYTGVSHHQISVLVL